MEPLTFALPKGRLQDEVLDLLNKAGYATDADVGRRLVFEDRSGTLRFIMAKPADVPTYVEYGAAALGVVGLDVLREGRWDVIEPLALGVGVCRLSLAGPLSWRERNLRLQPGLRVASKYPRLTHEFFQAQSISAEIIYLNGSVELAPAVGLADLLVDMVQSGRTLVENGLAELQTILPSEAVLIVNRAAHKMQFERIEAIVDKLAAVVARRKEGVV